MRYIFSVDPSVDQRYRHDVERLYEQQRLLVEWKSGDLHHGYRHREHGNIFGRNANIKNIVVTTTLRLNFIFLTLDTNS